MPRRIPSHRRALRSKPLVGGLRSISESRSLRAFLTALALSAGICACGHPATEGECQAILDRIVALELKAQRVTDPAEITKRRNESLGLGGAKDAKSTVLQGCIGKRIADSALACVQSAETSAEITDRCLQ